MALRKLRNDVEQLNGVKASEQRPNDVQIKFRPGLVDMSAVSFYDHEHPWRAQTLKPARMYRKAWVNLVTSCRRDTIMDSLPVNRRLAATEPLLRPGRVEGPQDPAGILGGTHTHMRRCFYSGL